MARAITVLVSTLVFGLVGLLIGWLNIQAQTRPFESRITSDDLLFSYGVAPLAGAAIGFGLSVAAMKMFARPDKSN